MMSTVKYNHWKRFYSPVQSYYFPNRRVQAAVFFEYLPLALSKNQVQLGRQLDFLY